VGLVLAALLTLLTATGCGGSDEPDEASESSPGGSGAPTPDPPRTSAPASPSPSAADGRSVAACEDGDCQILVTEPVTVRFRTPSGATATLQVTEVGPNEVAYTLKSGQGQAKGSARGAGQGCVTAFRANGSGTSCGGMGDGAKPSPVPDAVVIQAATGGDGTARLDIVSP
jgi:hypothetical protein